MLDYVILVDAENNDQLRDFRDRLQSHVCACADIDGKDSKHCIGVRDAGALRKRYRCKGLHPHFIFSKTEISQRIKSQCHDIFESHLVHCTP